MMNPPIPPMIVFIREKACICFVQLKPVQGLRLVPVPLLSLGVQNDCCVLNSNRGKMLAGNGSGKCIWGNKDMLMRKTVRSDEGKKKKKIPSVTLLREGFKEIAEVNLSEAAS